MSDDTQVRQQRHIGTIARDLVADAIERFGETDDFTFDVGIIAVPTPDGQLSVCGTLLMSLPNPLLGTGNMVRTLIVQDINALRNPEMVDHAVLDSIAQLREQRSVLLNPDTPSPSGLILPG